VKAYRPEIWSMVMQSAPQMRGETLVVQGAADPLIEARERAAELTEAAYGVMFRHGVIASSVDLELDLWRTLTGTVRRNQQAARAAN